MSQETGEGSERKYRSVNDFLVAPLGKGADLKSYGLEDLEVIRSGYGAIFSTQAYAGVRERVVSHRLATIYTPTIASLDAEFQRYDATDPIALSAFIQKVFKVMRLYRGVFAETIQQQEAQILAADQNDTIRAYYDNLLEVIKLTDFESGGFSADSRERYSTFFNYVGTGANSLIEGVQTLLVPTVPIQYRQLTGRFPAPSTITHLARRSYGATDRSASTSFDVIDIIGNATGTDMLLSLEQEQVDHTDEYKAELSKYNAMFNNKGCPFKRSGALLEPHVGTRFRPNPLSDSYFGLIDIVEGKR